MRGREGYLLGFLMVRCWVGGNILEREGIFHLAKGEGYEKRGRESKMTVFFDQNPADWKIGRLANQRSWKRVKLVMRYRMQDMEIPAPFSFPPAWDFCLKV